uniref:Protein hemingway n=1 Tax=Stomoxys calcitrans TaxID=35570 RepID=A0A1I8PVF3_STOCA
MSAESYNSDDERYADDTFEQGSDTDVPEVPEIESEISEVSDAEDEQRLLTVKLNTAPVRRNYHNIRPLPANTDSVPFDSSSDEEDDVIVGETLVEINTPSMHFLEEDEDHAITTRREIRPQRYESMQQLKSIDEQSDDSVCEEEEEEILNSEDERELQRIREMEESYLLQNSAKTPKKTLQNNSSSKEVDVNHKMLAELVMQQETEIEIIEEATTSDDTYANNSFDADIDPIPELIERVMEKFTAQPQTPPQFQTDFVEIVRNSSLEQIEQIDAIITDELKPHSFMPDNSIRMTFNFEPNDILSPENIAKAFFDAIEATNLDFALNNGGEQQNNFSSCGEDSGENVDSKKSMDNSKTTTTESSDESTVIYQQDNERTTDFGEEEVELERPETTNPSSMPANDEADGTHNYAESYYDTQYEYQITSKAPSCFNSDDYVFHANFIRPTPSTDRLRARPHPRKSMSFSNERMREIERHNQILLRKILTQKPTYMSKSAQHKVPNKTNSQTQVRLTTSAVNRKKQQRQIEMDNQVLQRKIEAIALRRRPLIS